MITVTNEKHEKLIGKMFKDVKEFREAFCLDVGKEDLRGDDITLHDSLIIEELRELTEATEEVDRLDAIVDSCYVLMGRAVHGQKESSFIGYFVDVLINMAHGMGYDFEGAWDEIHASNMSKICANLEEAIDTANSYYERQYKSIDIDSHENYFIVKNETDVTLPCGNFVKAGKVLKSILYQQADLTPFVPQA